ERDSQLPIDYYVVFEDESGRPISLSKRERTQVEEYLSRPGGGRPGLGEAFEVPRPWSMIEGVPWSGYRIKDIINRPDPENQIPSQHVIKSWLYVQPVDLERRKWNPRLAKVVKLGPKKSRAASMTAATDRR